MFRSDPALDRLVGRAIKAARDLGHPRTGSEHLLLALHPDNPAIRAAVHAAAPLGAGAAADREVLAPLGVAHLVDLTSVDRPPRREPLLPLGVAKARQRCARLDPPLGLDAQAVYEASLRLALARRERVHRPHHLAMALLALDPGVAWVLATAGLDREAMLAELVAQFPPPRRNAFLRAERRIGRSVRHNDIVRRYQHTTGRIATAHLGRVL
ncbi:peptidase [Lentzea tibetensis]|uniref:Peptidase n=1 Tax=Lentzea tibetensis TaxID=2591470 RepID=A0A563EUU9_9PSEU|nr:Clp protease N-terminal domain-containing protein [Lentzea tibetensis]TWP50924.1 peptidase [Lentzea tibetensis]